MYFRSGCSLRGATLQVIARGGSNQLGFVLPTAEADGGAYSRMKAMVMDEMKAYFRPELLNRLDEVVVFKSLEKTEVGTSHMPLCSS